MQYVHRVLERQLIEYINYFPVVGLTGPRQSGKSTLLMHLLKDYQYITFDDFKMVQQFQEDPEGFMQRYARQVIFDEVHYVPELFNYLKLAVDQDRQHYGKYVVTGSSQFALLRKASESLAGRIGLLTLLPFQFTEMPIHLRTECIYRGGYPELVAREYALSSAWYSSYFDTYLNKDVRAISNIGDMRNFRRFIYLLAANTSQVLNMSTYSHDLGVSLPTINRWLSILEASYVIFLLPPYYKNFNKRITKSPKLYFYDTGLVSYLTGIQNAELYHNGPMAGALFENYIVSEVIKKETHHNTHSEFFYYRTSSGLEVDLIIDRKTHKDIIEIKKSATFRTPMLAGIKHLIEAQDKAYLLYQGATISFDPTIQILNYQDYLS